MGRYINQNSENQFIGVSFKDKVANLIADGAVKIPVPTTWQEGLVCVIDNGWMAAAGYAYDEREMQEFSQIGERPTQWLLYPLAKDLAK